MGLPDCFLSQGEGGGVIQGSASEGTLVALLAARTKALKHMRLQSPGLDDHELFSKMTLYASDQVTLRSLFLRLVLRRMHCTPPLCTLRIEPSVLYRIQFTGARARCSSSRSDSKSCFVSCLD